MLLSVLTDISLLKVNAILVNAILVSCDYLRNSFTKGRTKDANKVSSNHRNAVMVH